jgi:hypothetical protein
VIASFPAGATEDVSSIGDPVTSLTSASDGNLYGHTRTAAFRVSLSPSPAVTVLGQFPDGLAPRGASNRAYAMVEGLDGNLYGLAETAIFSTIGRVFKLTKAGVISELASYPAGAKFGYLGAITLLPGGEMMVVSENSSGGQGSVFEVKTDGSTRLLRNFILGGGALARPRGQLCRVSDGTLYGVCGDGGANGLGGIYKLTPDMASPPNYTFAGVYDFTGTPSGEKPMCGLVAASDGKLYGTTAVATTTTNNTVFESVPAKLYRFNPGDNSVEFIHAFDTPTGWQFSGPLYHESQYAYLVAARGREGDTGVVTKLDTTGMLAPAPQVPGTGSIYLRRGTGSLARAADGALVGMRETETATPRIAGTIYRIDPTTNVHTNVGALGNANTVSPTGGLLLRGNGEVWGHENFIDTVSGNAVASRLFKLDGMAVFSLGYEFASGGTLGTQTIGNLVEDGAGNLYGMTAGKVFKLAASATDPVAHATVPTATIGSRLTIAADGTLFVLGGNVISKITPAGVVSTIYTFAATGTDAKTTSEGFRPRDIVLGNDGLLYGVCESGGASGFPGQGTIWRVNPATKAFTKLFDLSGAQGTGPHSISRAESGRLFVVTPYTVLGFTPPRLGNIVPKAAADVVNLPVAGFNVTANDFDGDADSLVVTTFTQGKTGSVSFSGNNVTYTPGVNFKSSDTFTYTVSDGNGGTATATVTVKNQPPVAVADKAPIFGATVQFSPMANDSDANGDTLAFSITKQPALGTVQFNMDGSVTYTRGAKFVSADVFEYAINDGRGGIAKALASIEAPVTFSRGNYRAFLADPGNALGRSINLTLAANGGVTGTAVFYGKKTTLKTAYPLMGPLVINVLDPMGSTIPITLTLNISGGNIPTLDGTFGNDPVHLERAVYSKKAKAPQAGYYTALVEEGAFVADNPHGVGFLTFTIAPDGKTNIVGKLGDGTPVSASAAMFNNGEIPFYAALYTAKTFVSPGSITGVLSPEPMPVFAHYTASLRWQRPPLVNVGTAGAYYPNGFATNVELEAARYTATKPVFPLAGTSPNLVAKSLYGGVTALTAGALPVEQDVTLSAKNLITFSLPNNLLLAMKVDAKTGLVTGSITQPMSPKRTVFGVVQQLRKEIGCTFFGVPPQTGSIQIMEP